MDLMDDSATPRLTPLQTSRKNSLMLYFAYGSNLDFAQMRQRCPSAKFVSIAKLPDHRLDFTRKSLTRGCGVADVVPELGRAVWGVVFAVEETDIGSLDASEGYRPGRPDTENSYVRQQLMCGATGILTSLCWSRSTSPTASQIHRCPTPLTRRRSSKEPASGICRRTTWLNWNRSAPPE